MASATQRSSTQQSDQALQMCVEALIALDDAYHWLQYAGSAPGASRPQNAPAIPDPFTYFTALAMPHRAATPELQAPPSATPRMCSGADGTGVDGGPLAQLHRARCHETQLFFGARAVAVRELRASGVGSSVQDAQPKTMKQGDPVCDPLLARWRDTVRTFACRAYAFAVPSAEALAALAKHGPLVEWGAGTGYWAAMLQRAGADVVALDCQPTASGAGHAYSDASCLTATPTLYL